MNQEKKKNLWHHIVAGARDIIVVTTVISIISAITVATTRPFWEPFADIPEVLAQQQEDLAALSIEVSRRLKPEIVEFEGKAQIVSGGNVLPGETITFLYFLRRNATCETKVLTRFYDVDRGINIVTGTTIASQAPVTQSFIPFRVDIKIPILPSGRYIYNPTINPVDCGVYKEMAVIPSEIFEVRSRERGTDN